MNAWDLIEFNFPGSRNRPDVVNWYLYNKMNCRETTGDGLNYLFSVGMKVYYPKKNGAPAPAPAPAPGIAPPAVHPFRKGWTTASVADFQGYVERVGLSYRHSVLFRIDCANFALHLLLEYSKANFLPVAFQYSGGILKAEFESILSYQGFANTVKQRIGAPDLYNASYPNTVSQPGVDFLHPGDLLVGAKHVMVIYKNPSLIDVPGVAGKRLVMEVLQGNLDTWPVPWKEVPMDTRVQHRAYDLRIKAGYKNEGNGWEHRDDNTNLQDLVKLQGFVPRRWNFSWFNQVYGFPAL
jgi:hypothetical protein